MLKLQINLNTCQVVVCFVFYEREVEHVFCLVQSSKQDIKEMIYLSFKSMQKAL